MDPIEGAGLEQNRAALERSVPSSNSSERNSALRNRFEALLQSSSDDEMRKTLSSILRLEGTSPDLISFRERSRLFRIGLPDLEPQIVFGDGTMATEGPDDLQHILREIEIGLISAGPYLTLYTNASEFRELQTRIGLGSSSFLSYRLSHTHFWLFRRDPNRIYGEISDLRLKVMSPVMFAALTAKPIIVHFLMKYGTRFEDETHGLKIDADSLSMREVCTRALLSDIIKELFESGEWDSDALQLKTDFSNLPEGLRSKCLNFRLLLRCDPNLYVTTFKLGTVIGSQFPPLPEMNVVRHVYHSLFPELNLGLCSPPLLKHICKCIVRERLHENWQLPDGIPKLELPSILYDYVGLLHD